MTKKQSKLSTKLARSGLNPKKNFGIPNPPVYHASTILYPNAKSRRNRDVPYEYGRFGTPTSEALSKSISDLYNAEGAVLLPSGLAAAIVSILAFVNSGDHIMVTDSVYGSTRNFLQDYLPRINVEVEFFPPRLPPSKIKEHFKENTKLIYLESPGSLTFELQDLRSISQISNENNIISLTDNTWATALGQNCFLLGIDVVIESFTKYVVGHSDVMMGGVIANGKLLEKIKKQVRIMGQCCGPDDIYLAIRGLRTMELRLNKSFESSLVIAEWLSKHPFISKVIHPARKDHPDYNIFQKEYNKGAGLFSIELNTKNLKTVDTFIDELRLFGIGASWGGYESLIIEADLEDIRIHETYKEGKILRLGIGLEEPEDLIGDLENALRKIS